MYFAFEGVTIVKEEAGEEDEEEGWLSKLPQVPQIYLFV